MIVEINLNRYQSLLSTDIADAMGQSCAMDIGLSCLMAQDESIPKLMGFAFTVRCENRSNTYLHDSIYAAPKGSVIVVETDSLDYAVAGGNVCAVAQQNGILGFVVDGVIRDIGEIRSIGFPVFARGVYPKPGKKGIDGASQIPIECGGLKVQNGDLVIADEEGIVVISREKIEETLELALVKKAQAEKTSLDQWRANHQQKIQSIVGK